MTQLALDDVLLGVAERQGLTLLVRGVDRPARVDQHRVDVGVGRALDGLARVGGQRSALDQQAAPGVCSWLSMSS